MLAILCTILEPMSHTVAITLDNTLPEMERICLALSRHPRLNVEVGLASQKTTLPHLTPLEWGLIWALKPLYDHHLLLPKPLILRTGLQTIDLSGHLPEVCSGQWTGPKYLDANETLAFEIEAFVPDGYSERDLWGAYREGLDLDRQTLIRQGHENLEIGPSTRALMFDLNGEGQLTLYGQMGRFYRGTVYPLVCAINACQGWPTDLGLEECVFQAFDFATHP